MRLKCASLIIILIAVLCRFAPAWGAAPVMVQNSEKTAEETLGSQVTVVSPAYCSDVKGNTTVTLAAPGFKTVVVKCWKQGEGFGSDSTVATGGGWPVDLSRYDGVADMYVDYVRVYSGAAASQTGGAQ